MKRVYFVRHGESESNVNNLTQGLHDPLSPEGELQAVRIAERVKGLEFKAIISSDAVRTKQTADIIANVSGISIEENPNFREVRRPSSLVGTPRSTAEYLAFKATEYEHLADDNWHFEDEENYRDIYARAEEAKRCIESHPAESILVVTHGHFLRFLVPFLIMGDVMTPEVWRHISRKFEATNTGLTVCVQRSTGWHLIVWNDIAHLAD